MNHDDAQGDRPLRLYVPVSLTMFRPHLEAIDAQALQTGAPRSVVLRRILDAHLPTSGTCPVCGNTFVDDEVGELSVEPARRPRRARSQANAARYQQAAFTTQRGAK